DASRSYDFNPSGRPGGASALCPGLGPPTTKPTPQSPIKSNLEVSSEGALGNSSLPRRSCPFLTLRAPRTENPVVSRPKGAPVERPILLARGLAAEGPATWHAAEAPVVEASEIPTP